MVDLQVVVEAENELTLPELVRFVSWLLPIPFMLLYFVKTKRLNKYTDFAFYVLVAAFVGLFFADSNRLGFSFWLLQYYVMAVNAVFLLYRRKLDFPQALSLAFNTVYFNSFFWEIPIHVYTPIAKGFIDQAASLHLLYVFPFFFIYSVTDIKVTRENLAVLALNFAVSTFLMWLLLALNIDIWNVTAEPFDRRFIVEFTWLVNRIFSLTCLTAIVYGGIKPNEN